MTPEEALNVVEHVLKQKQLNKVQQLVFCQSWLGKSYMDIAKAFDYDPGYIKDTGSKLWQSLSNAFNEKVTKYNLQSVLKRAVGEESREFKLGIRQTFSSMLYSQASASKIDWGEAIDVSNFCGRADEVALLNQWLLHDRCRLIALMGTGGIGKTALSVQLAEQVQGEFDYVIWRSLRYAPPLSELLAKIIQFFLNQQQAEESLPKHVGDRISYLIDYFRNFRCLLILDGFDAISFSKLRDDKQKEDYEAYGELLHRVGETQHQSCLVMTGRQKPIEIAALQGEQLPVRALRLAGLDTTACQRILMTKGLIGSNEEVASLIKRCHNNPMALKIAATLIQDSFNGKINNFIKSNEFIAQEDESPKFIHNASFINSAKEPVLTKCAASWDVATECGADSASTVYSHYYSGYLATVN